MKVISQLNSATQTTPNNEGRFSAFLNRFFKISINPRHLIVLLGTFLLLMAGAYLIYELQPEIEQLHAERMNSTWGFYLIVLAMSLLLLRLAFFPF